MREFFRGWKRKVGVVTLVMACAFTVGWIRSEFAIDQLRLHSETLGMKLKLDSRYGQCRLDVSWDGRESLVGVDVSSFPISNENRQQLESSMWFFRYFEYVMGSSDGRRVTSIKGSALTLNYCVMAIPLTLLSAWLLLSKPRPVSKHAATTPPVAEV